VQQASLKQRHCVLLYIPHIAALLRPLANRVLQSCCFNSGSRQRKSSRSARPHQYQPQDQRTAGFLPFTREDAHSSQNGLGLGLYIASEMARAHQGELIIISTMEETRFTFCMSISA
jgi:hypothetical protein